jgi:hypothetical protein
MGIYYWLRDLWKLAYISHRRIRLNLSYQIETRKLAKEGASPDEVQNTIRGRFKGEHRLIFGEESGLWSDRVLRKVRKYRIPYPDQLEDSPNWWRPRYLHRWILTEEGYDLLKPKIREEEKYRREVAEFWLKIFGFWVQSITTLLSIIVAILALTLKH